MLARLRDAVGRETAFLAEARQRGLPRGLARLLEPAAEHVHPDDPGRVLHARELLERTALRVAFGEWDNLEVDHAVVEKLADAFEQLGMARSADVPDPFRRLALRPGGGERLAAIALTCAHGELAVLLPPGTEAPEPGSRVELSYGGFSAPVVLDLMVTDSCHFPRALLLHVARPLGEGPIGRTEERHEISWTGTLRRAHTETSAPCRAVDLGLGGLALRTHERIGAQEQLVLGFDGTGEHAEPMTLDVRVVWARTAPDGEQHLGVQLLESSGPQAQALQRAVLALSGLDVPAPPPERVAEIVEVTADDELDPPATDDDADDEPGFTL